MSSQTGNVALITGAASGIGRATAGKLASQGYGVVVADFDRRAGQQVAGQLSGGGVDALFVEVDVADSASVEALMQATDRHFGRLDVLVNCAGVGVQQAPVAELALEQWHRAIDINLNGTFYCMHYGLPLMLKNGSGSIINLSSVTGAVGAPTRSAYTASKHGVAGLTRAAAQEYAAQGIRINAIAPGVVETPFTEASRADEGLSNMMRQVTPLGRFAAPEEIAELIAFLASPAAGYITGAFYPIDGGYLAH